MSDVPSYDLIVYGATGYTGRFITRYLAERSRTIDGLRWAIAGRSRDRLEALRAEIAAEDAGIVVADIDDPASLDEMTASARVVLTAVGPYQRYGTPLVEACVRAGTDYLDLCGESNWMRQMIDAQQEAARANGARLLFSCGFDSIPSELGVLFLQAAAKERFGAPLPRVRGRVVTFVGGPSGGSVASGMAMMKAAGEDAAFAKLLQDPFALTPGFRGPDQPTGQDIAIEEDVGPVRPFTLGPTDVKNVHRSNYLMDHAYGADFVYDEMLVGEPPEGGPPSVASLPKPGEGPGEEVIAEGRFEILFIGSDGNDRQLRARVTGTRDPGFGATSRMVVETALTLATDLVLPPGIWTPGAAFQQGLIARLTEHADMTFEILDD